MNDMYEIIQNRIKTSTMNSYTNLLYQTKTPTSYLRDHKNPLSCAGVNNINYFNVFLTVHHSIDLFISPT
jgi:hypothetical protein